MAETIGTEYIQIEPSFQGVNSAIEKEMGAAGESGGNSFGTGFAKVMGGTGKAIAGAVAAGGAAVTAMGTAFVNATNNVASYGDNIDKMAQKMGISIESYQEWDAVMQHSGTSMETMKASMKTLANAAETGNKAFAELGITEEQIASMNQEQLFEATISALQQVEDDTQRTYLAGKVLGKGATELGALLNTSAEDTQAMRDRVRELGGVMSEDAVKAAAAYQDQLQDMQTAFSGLSRNLMAEFLPAVTDVMGGLTEIFSGNSDKGLGMIQGGINNILDGLTSALPQVVEVASGIVEALGTAIMQNLPKIAQTGMQLVTQLAGYIIENLPLMIETAMQIIVEIANGLAEALPTLIPTIVLVITQIVQTLIDNVPMLVQAAVQLMLGLANGLIAALPVLIQQLPVIIQSIITALITAIPLLIEGAIQLVNGIVAALPEIIMALVEALPQIIEAIINGLIEALPLLIEGSIQLTTMLVTHLPEIIMALIQAIPQIVQSIVTALINAAPKLLEAAKTMIETLKTGWQNFFPALVNSAVLLFNNLKTTLLNIGKKFIEIGKQIVEGIKKGISDAWDAFKDWVTGLLSGLVDGIKEFFHIGSPSKLMADEIGRWIPAGIAEGIEKGMGLVDNAMSGMSNDILMSARVTAADVPQFAASEMTGGSDDSLYQLLATYLPQIAAGGKVNITLDGDAGRLFRLMQRESVRNTQMVGVNSVLSAI